MWSRAQGLSDHELVDFKIEDDLVEVNFLSEGGPLPSRHTLINDIRFEAHLPLTGQLSLARLGCPKLMMLRERDLCTLGRSCFPFVNLSLDEHSSDLGLIGYMTPLTVYVSFLTWVQSLRLS